MNHLVAGQRRGSREEDSRHPKIQAESHKLLPLQLTAGSDVSVLPPGLDLCRKILSPGTSCCHRAGAEGMGALEDLPPNSCQACG